MEDNQIYEGDCLEVMREMEPDTFDGIVTDPPYGLEFMGKEWDHGIPGIPFWVEALRVAKPGAHLLAFGGDRTHHRLMCAIEDAGWEIRTCIAWIFGSGFPKSLNVGKSMRKQFSSDVLCSCENHLTKITQDFQCDYPEDFRYDDEQPLQAQDIDQCVPPLQVDALSHIHDDQRGGDLVSRQANTFLGEEIDHQTSAGSWSRWVRHEADSQLIGSKQSDTQENMSPSLSQGSHKTVFDIQNTQDSVCGLVSSPLDTPSMRNSNIPHCPKCGKVRSEYYEGFGTALKPSWEIIIVARKPLEGTVAANVLKWGTGGINVDGGRVGTFNDGAARSNTPGSGRFNKSANSFIYGGGKGPQPPMTKLDENQGRFPANLIHDGSEEVLELFPVTTSGKVKEGYKRNVDSPFMQGNGVQLTGFGDTGSAARFFYCAKASRSERGNGNNHPTVKPIALLVYLVKLITPEGALILDPFGGSGSTAIACQNTNRRYVLIEKEHQYVEIARRRIAERLL